MRSKTNCQSLQRAGLKSVPEYCFTLMKQDQLQNHKVGGEVEVEFSVDSREFNGKWYHNINAVSLSKAFSDLPF